MKIAETVERDCCHEQKDLRKYSGRQRDAKDALLFCVHCGQVWIWDRRMDAAGSMEDFLRAIQVGEGS